MANTIKAVVGNEDSTMWDVSRGQVCEVKREYFDNGESWYELKDYTTGYTFESPSVLWDDIEGDMYKVIDYFDVWGNEKDGFEVNNLAQIGTVLIKDYTDSREIVKQMKEIGYLAKHVRSNMFTVYNDYDMIEYSRKNGKPVFRLERIL